MKTVDSNVCELFRKTRNLCSRLFSAIFGFVNTGVDSSMVIAQLIQHLGCGYNSAWIALKCCISIHDPREDEPE